MDAVPPGALELSAALRDGGDTFPHEALAPFVMLLPPDLRARAACVCRAWRAATAHPTLREELDFRRCVAPINDATLASLCVRAGTALRTLYLDSDACEFVSAAGMLAALRGGGCTGVLRLSTQIPDDELFSWFHYRLVVLDAPTVQQLAAACPMLQHATCAVRCNLSEAAAVLTALPGPLALFCEGESEVGLTQVIECLRLKTTKLQSLLLYRSKIGAMGASRLADCLRVNSTLTGLDLFSCRIGDAGATQLADCLRVNTALRSLELQGNGIGDEGATTLADSLRVNTSLKSLNLSWNSIGDAGATQLAECLRINDTLTRLNLMAPADGIGLEGMTQLAACLRVNATLTSLELGGYNIDTAPLMKFSECLQIDTKLKTLTLRIRSVAGLTQHLEFLRMNTTLTSLNLYGNWFCGAAATQLVVYLRTTATLKSLKLVCTSIGAVGAAQLAECLQVNTSLTSMDLSSNNLGAAGATHLAACLRVNATLTRLNLSGNNIGDAGAAQLAECLRVNAALTSLDLNHNNIGDAGVVQLAQCLCVNATLTSLVLSLNYFPGIDDDDVDNSGVEQLAECLRVNTTLRYLDLRMQNGVLVDGLGPDATHLLQVACPPRCTLRM